MYSILVDHFHYITYTNYMEILKKLIAWIFDFLQSIVVVMAILVMIYLFIISPQEISGDSMFPTFKNGEYILTNKVEYKLHEPQRGDVIVFKSPKNKDIDYIKRIIGIPGDTVSLRDGKFYVNGELLDEHYLPPYIYTFAGSFMKENTEVTVPEGYYFVVGDNRPHSLDSREFGFVPKQDIIGKAFFRYWPFERAGLIKNPNAEKK